MHPRRLLVASFLSLFVELALIRWIPATLHVVGFFANLVLIATFLGLGIGLTKPTGGGKTVWRALFRLSILMAGLALVEIVGIRVSLPKIGDYALNEVQTGFPISIPLPLVLIAVYAGAVWATIPFGQLVAEHFDELERIKAYSINIAGSIAGVAGFSLVAWLALPPVAWFGVIVVALLALQQSRAHAVPVLLILAVLIGLQLHDTHSLGSTIEWSPYYKVVTHSVVPHGRLDQGFITDVNGQFLLSGLDLRPNATLPQTVSPQVRADVQSLKSYYSFPFSIADSPRVLILGAGAGNDVAAALRHGARTVVAVEIDPLVEQLGVDHHPEHPYQSPNVRVVINDGRAFLDHDHETFDLVMYATLDAHGLLSAASNVRLDSFIYTRESLMQAKKHLAPDGLLVLSFGPFREDIQYRQYEMVRSVFGQDPLYFEHTNGHRTIVAGDLARVDATRAGADWRPIGAAEIAAKLRQYPYATIAATDDWPQLYLRSRGIPLEYAYVLAGMIAVGLLLVGRSFRGGRALQPHFLFLGAGFLLLETKSITEYALLFGSTWQTNSFVFIVILAVILVANLITLRSPGFVRVPIVYSLLLGSLIASFVWPIRSWVPQPGIGRDLAAAAYLGIPLFLAALIFANTFKSTRLGSAALASNLIGAVLGGVAEYASLATGIRALSLLAVVMYIASVFRVRARETQPAS